MAFDQPVTVIAKLLQLTPRRVQQLVREEIIPSPVGKKYDPILSVHGYIDYLKKKIEGSGDLSITDERKRMIRTQTRKNEIEIEALQRSLVPLEDVKHQVSEILMALRGEILGLPGRLAPDLSVISEPAKVRAALMEEFSRSLNNVADKLEKLVQ